MKAEIASDARRMLRASHGQNNRILDYHNQVVVYSIQILGLSFGLIITGRQLRAARALLGMEQIELAKHSRVAIGTIRRMESFDGEVGARTSTLSQVQKALERAGVEFLNDGQPGVRLKRQPH